MKDRAYIVNPFSREGYYLNGKRDGWQRFDHTTQKEVDPFWTDPTHSIDDLERAYATPIFHRHAVEWAHGLKAEMGVSVICTPLSAGGLTHDIDRVSALISQTCDFHVSKNLSILIFYHSGKLFYATDVSVKNIVALIDKSAFTDSFEELCSTHVSCVQRVFTEVVNEAIANHSDVYNYTEEDYYHPTEQKKSSSIPAVMSPLQYTALDTTHGTHFHHAPTSNPKEVKELDLGEVPVLEEDDEAQSESGFKEIDGKRVRVLAAPMTITGFNGDYDGNTDSDLLVPNSKRSESLSKPGDKIALCGGSELIRSLRLKERNIYCGRDSYWPNTGPDNNLSYKPPKHHRNKGNFKDKARRK